MRIEVAELWRRLPASAVPNTITVNYGQNLWEAALYLPIPRAAELQKLDSFVQGVPPAVRRSIDAVVLRPHPEDAAQLRSDPTIARSLIERVEGRPCYTAEMIGATHHVRPLGNAPPIGEADAKVIMRSLRHAELENLMQRPSVVLPKTGAFHYEGPNGAHYEMFLRPGMALQSPDTVDGVVFWLLPRVQPESAVLLDTWSMMSLGYALQIAAKDLITRVASVQRYDEPVEEILRRLESRDGSLPQSVLLIVSISSTGTLIKRLRDGCNAWGGKRRRVDAVSLFSSAQASDGDVGEVYCEVSAEFRRARTGDCQACKIHRRPIVRIDPSTYLLEMSAAVEKTA